MPSDEMWLGFDGFCKYIGLQRRTCDNTYRLVYLNNLLLTGNLLLHNMLVFWVG